MNIAIPDTVDPVIAAKAAGLRYVSDASAGITRRKKGKSFNYLGPDGKTVRDAETLARIRALAVPPAWTEVWICPVANGHIQATGRDARGRKQYRYHARWRSKRDETKYERMIPFGKVLPSIRRRLDADMARPGLPREKVLATVVRLLEATLIRVGNEEYARTNKSFGLTTLKDRHVTFATGKVTFRFRGKSGKQHEIELADPRLASIVKKCRDIPGQELFQYVDEEGANRTIDSGDVNDYLREIAGDEFTAKDFRTWNGTVLAAVALAASEAAGTVKQAKRNILAAVEAVSGRLGNTPAICRRCYIHPTIFDCYLDQTLVIARGPRRKPRAGALDADEAAVLRLLERRLKASREDVKSLLRKSIKKARNAA